MRVLFYAAEPAWSGRARAFAALARALAERGHAVTMVCPPDSPLERRLEYGAYEVVPLASDAPSAVTAERLRRALQERFVEVVCVHTDREHVAAALAARLAERAAVLRRVPAGTVPALGARARTALRVASTGFLFATEEDLRRAPRIPRARLAPAVVPPGLRAGLYDAVEPAALEALDLDAEEDPQLMVCHVDGGGRTQSAIVLRVVAMLAARHPRLRLAIVGPGSTAEDLRMHAAALRIARRVRFLGERDDQLAIFARADLAWIMSAGDEGAYAALDAMGVEVPVLAPAGAVAGEFVPDGIAGAALPPADAHAAAAEIARLLAQPERRAAMGGAGRVRVARDFDETVMVDAFERAALVASDRSQW